MSNPRSSTLLERLDKGTIHEFQNPSKRIDDRDDLSFFFASTAYRDLTIWLFQLNRAMFPVKLNDGSIELHSTNRVGHASLHVIAVRELLMALSGFLKQAPPHTGPRRFGNVAFRDWFRLVEESATDLIKSHLAGIISVSDNTTTAITQSIVEELKAYLLGSFGSSQRLDYGTGHELSFLAFLGCLWKLGAFEQGEESSIVIGIIQPYLELVRTLIMTYTLEPAGSHGVWGLDDHSFVPYIFGAAQFGPSIPRGDHSMPVPTEGSLPTAPSPSSVTNKATVAGYKDSNMYFGAIQFIHDVKTGPFWEHSPVLYDISGIKDGWGKINKGMLKMYAAEVLGKFPVVQHFPFGSLFRWEKDPDATNVPVSVHIQQQPTSPHTKDVPPSHAHTATAPWAKSASSLPQMQASTGMPTTRAPWATGNNQIGRTSAEARTSSTRATEAAAQSKSRHDMASTAAPWARKIP